MVVFVAVDRFALQMKFVLNWLLIKANSHSSHNNSIESAHRSFAAYWKSLNINVQTHKYSNTFWMQSFEISTTRAFFRCGRFVTARYHNKFLCIEDKQLLPMRKQRTTWNCNRNWDSFRKSGSPVKCCGRLRFRCTRLYAVLGPFLNAPLSLRFSAADCDVRWRVFAASRTSLHFIQRIQFRARRRLSQLDQFNLRVDIIL